jgi:hypothetical protein
MILNFILLKNKNIKKRRRTKLLASVGDEARSTKQKEHPRSAWAFPLYFPVLLNFVFSDAGIFKAKR